MFRMIFVLALATPLAFQAPAQSAEFTLVKPEKPHVEYSPFVNRSFPQRVFWGDTHLHTTYSPDAGMIGNFNLGPDDAYRFARGEQVTANNGMQAKLVRPLDFLVVSDHSEYQGLIPEIRGGNPAIMGDEVGKRWYNWYNQGPEGQYKVFLEFAQDLSANKGRIEFSEVARSTWDLMVQTADEFNDPGNFTAFIGYEWTSTPKGNNLHRVVIFRDDASKAGRVVPFSSFDSADPEDLWKYLANYESEIGGRVMAIPHNANVSNGQMYATETFDGKPITKSYAENRARFEPLHEMTQMKGDSETHPKLSPEDEFADYGTWDKANLTGEASPTAADLVGSYARSALLRGMQIKGMVGANPFKQGFIGSTDSHTSLATAGESNYFGKASILEPKPDRWKHVLIKSQTDDSLTTYGYETLASGLAAVWATENTREAIFDAMARRETYATTGPRILVRVFGGWNFGAKDVHRSNFAEYGYANGVPMGGDLSQAPAGKTPSFVIRALRDVDGANLDRIQIVKGWLDTQGNTWEKVYDVALSDGRRVGPDGKAPPVGNTVDLSGPSFANTIGDTLMFAHWTDPDFDPSLPTFYYIRVIEIPTPSWLAYDAKIFNVNMPEEAKMIHQERAYTSPIWYTPQS
ncbi:MAG: DUF3604 domain-containing protein [Hyphomicrobiaceae bacterium]